MYDLDQGDACAASAGGGLVLRDLDVVYGAAQALFGVSLTVPGGSALALLGVNGAGKSTIGRAASGLVPVGSGRVYFDGKDITSRPPHRISHAGLRYVPEGRGVFPGLSVGDNLRQAALAVGRRRRRRAIDGALDAFPVLAQRRHQRAGSLSGGEQQTLAMAMALLVEPRLIVADELSLGLAPKMVDAVFDGLRRARAAGITVVLVEQFADRALAFADDCVILGRGRVTWRGPAAMAGPEVLDHYLGGTAPTA